MPSARAYTEEEVREQFLAHLRFMTRYWATIPEIHTATGQTLTVLDRCEGVAHSMLTAIDGLSMGLPAFKLTVNPHPDDKKFHQDEGSNWYEPGTEITTEYLNDLFYKKLS